MTKEYTFGLGVVTVLSSTIVAAGAQMPVIGGIFAPVSGVVLGVAGGVLAMGKTIPGMLVGAGAVLSGLTLLGFSPLGTALGPAAAAIGVLLNFGSALKKLPVVGKYIPAMG